MKIRRDQLVANRFMEEMGKVVTNSFLLSRQAMMNAQLLDPKGRDYDRECGYPVGELDSSAYYKLYETVGVANRIVGVYPVESWSVLPEVYEIEQEVTTEFEQAWDALLKKHLVWHFLQRVDELAGIGRFGVLLMGFSDVKDEAGLESPVPGIDDDGKIDPRSRQKTELLYLRCFDESKVDVWSYETNITSPRYGMPKTYRIAFIDPNSYNTVGIDAVPAPARQLYLIVHWSRILHVADNRKSSEIYGMPRMRPVIPEIYDIRKTRGGSAEMFWRGAFPGYSFETLPELGTEVEPDLESIRDEFESYANGLKRYLALTGMTAKSLAPQVSDPSNHLHSYYQSICSTIGTPLRVFLGSESGKLASEVDIQTWNRRLANRQTMYLNPMLILPFVYHLVAAGVLPEPTNVLIAWNDLNSVTATNRADISLKKTQSMMQYVAGGVEQIMTPLDFLTKILNLSIEEAAGIIKTASRKNRKLLTKSAQAGGGQIQPTVSTAGHGGRLGNPNQPGEDTGRPPGAGGTATGQS